MTPPNMMVIDLQRGKLHRWGGIPQKSPAYLGLSKLQGYFLYTQNVENKVAYYIVKMF